MDATETGYVVEIYNDIRYISMSTIYSSLELCQINVSYTEAS